MWGLNEVLVLCNPRKIHAHTHMHMYTCTHTHTEEPLQLHWCYLGEV